MTSLLYSLKLPYFISLYNNFDKQRLMGFFNCNELESFIYFNTDKILVNNNYSSWKQYLKDFCYQHDKIDSWHKVHKKINSRQIVDYSLKKLALSDTRYLMILENCDMIRTPSLPCFSTKELTQYCKPQLDNVFKQLY